ncbi:hypothetical protein [Paenibacillus sp. 32352]|uniref:hypothetical protein n=1 Tax=Paenibacillus sp. 32352 TaxID=1969111 RepID=UPI0009AE16F1|nr:hypothetical protein [Paenibacillus sp. 32352]
MVQDRRILLHENAIAAKVLFYVAKSTLSGTAAKRGHNKDPEQKNVILITKGRDYNTWVKYKKQFEDADVSKKM